MLLLPPLLYHKFVFNTPNQCLAGFACSSLTSQFIIIMYSPANYKNGDFNEMIGVIIFICLCKEGIQPAI